MDILTIVILSIHEHGISFICVFFNFKMSYIQLLVYKCFTSFLNLHLDIVILFDAIINEIVFLISLSVSSLMVYKNAKNLCMWILLVLTIFWWNLYGFLHIISCYLQTVTILLLPFQYDCLLFLFLNKLLWLGLPVLCWIKVMGVGILILFLISEEKLSASHCWVWC